MPNCRLIYAYMLLILCILLPPLAVLFHKGCTIHVCINLLLTCLAWIPGVIHAFYVCYAMGVPTPTPIRIERQNLNTAFLH